VPTAVSQVTSLERLHERELFYVKSMWRKNIQHYIGRNDDELRSQLTLYRLYSRGGSESEPFIWNLDVVLLVP
jgi:hypothetical protein